MYSEDGFTNAIAVAAEDFTVWIRLLPSEHYPLQHGEHSLGSQGTNAIQITTMGAQEVSHLFRASVFSRVREVSVLSWVLFSMLRGFHRVGKHSHGELQGQALLSVLRPADSHHAPQANTPTILLP